jgi:hypothetical protein
MMRNKNRILKAVLSAAAIASLVAGGAIMCDGGKGPNGPDTPNGTDPVDPNAPSGSGLVGDWIPYSIKDGDGVHEYPDNPEYKNIRTFKSSGHMQDLEFIKVTNVWVEFPFDSKEAVKYRVSKDTIYARYPFFGEEAVGTFSNGNLVITDYDIDILCEDDDCDITEKYYDVTYKRVNIADFRSSLDGPVYPYNPALSGGEWVLQNGDGKYIAFSNVQFYGTGAALYTGEGNNNGSYYTNGDRLYLAADVCIWDQSTGSINCDPTQDPVELTYGVSGSGSNKTLTITGNGVNDVWTFAKNDYGFSPAGSKRSKRLPGADQYLKRRLPPRKDVRLIGAY